MTARETHIEHFNSIVTTTLQNTWLSVQIIAPIGLLLNIVFLFTVIRVKSMHTIINVYLSNLAVADSLYLLHEFLVSLFSPIKRDIFVQYALLGSKWIPQTASTFFVVTIAAERFSAVHHPLTFREKASKSRAAKISAGLWLPVIIIGVTLVFLPISESVFSQLIFWAAHIVNIFSFIVTLALYIYVVVKIYSPKPRLPNCPKQGRKVLWMVVINTAVFFILYSLDSAVAILSIVARNYTWLAQTVAFVFGKKLILLIACKRILQLINCSIDPLVYSATNSDYRKAVVQAFSFFKLCCPCYPRQNPSQPSQPWEQVELHVIPNPQNDQQHHAVRLNSSRPPNQGLAHTQTQLPLHSCQQQCSRPSSSKASMHKQQNSLVHAEPADSQQSLASTQEQCPGLTDTELSEQREQCVHAEPADSQLALASTQEQCPALTDTELSGQREQCMHPEPEGTLRESIV